MTAASLPALKALAEKALPGPWNVPIKVTQDFRAATDPATVLALLARVEEAEGAKAEVWDEAIGYAWRNHSDAHGNLSNSGAMSAVFDNPYRSKGAGDD